MIRFLMHKKTSELVLVSMDMDQTTAEERATMVEHTYKVARVGNDLVGYMKRSEFMRYTQRLRHQLESFIAEVV